ncbi:MAG: hypothetical protein JWP67_3131, partial [Mucilaginibacter sp.]|nr:hypothetical protein [Mucilaginibacter sp.]
MKKLLLVSLCFLVLFITQGYAQNRTVTGTVISKDDGLPLPGVTVTVVGTTFSTQTNQNGRFSINLSPNSKKLSFSFIGFSPQQVAVGSSNDLSISLTADSRALSEVVVVGYQSVRKADLTGAASVVDAKQFEAKPIPSFLQNLQGAAPGVQATASSGRPGNNAVIRIRGTGSINASSEPLIVLDGIQISSTAYNGLNADDIENVTILKDAQAVAIYGSRGSNGVILVTTKTGKPNAPTLRYSFRYGKSQRQPLQNVQLMNSAQKLQYEYEL